VLDTQLGVLGQAFSSSVVEKLGDDIMSMKMNKKAFI
jgi:hypothetical protein